MKYLFPLVVLLAGCGARTSLAELALDACNGEVPTCIAPSTACEAPRVVAPFCDVDKRYACPLGSRVHTRVANESVCLPFHEDERISSMSGSLVRIPANDGRCLWIAEEARVDGRDQRNVALTTELDTPFGACPKRATSITTGVVVGETGGSQVQLTGGYRLGGSTHVLFRWFREDPDAPFGVRHVGSGVAAFGADRILLPGAPRFLPDLDLGDAHYVDGDHAFVWGCPGPPDFLTERCIVGRLDASDTMELFTGSNWVASARGRDGKTVFDSGPWISSVTRSGDTLRHVFSVGFGSDLQLHTATAPEGPWSSATTIAKCALPDDPKAFCAGPVVHEELADPTRPGELVVTYGVGTTRGGERAPADVWPRLVTIP